MSKFDEFDLDLQSVKARGKGSGGGKGGGVTSHTVEISDSIAYCTKNGQWNSCLCSTCCTGHTYGRCSNEC